MQRFTVTQNKVTKEGKMNYIDGKKSEKGKRYRYERDENRTNKINHTR
jgi:hypothetical protein